MILTDTSVVIAYERAPTPRLTQIIQSNAAAVCGLTVAELFAGVRTPAHEARCVATIASFQQLPIPEVLWEAAGRHQALLRARGVTVQLADTVIATLALFQNVDLWSYDLHFTLIRGVLSPLRLFQEPP